MTDTSEPAYYAVSFSPAGGYYTLAYQGPDIPFQKLIAANGTGRLIATPSDRGLLSDCCDATVRQWHHARRQCCSE